MTNQDSKYSRRTFLKWLGVSVSVPYLASCAMPVAPAVQTEEAAAGQPAQEAVKIVLTHWGGVEQAQYMQEVADAFMEANPGVTVDRIQFPDSYDEKLLTMIAGGTAPDVQMMTRFTYFSFVVKRTLLNLQPHLDTIGFNRDDYFEVGVRPYTHKGNLYGMPREIDAWIVFYNKTLFEEAGVESPAADWTWDDLVENAKALTKRDAEGPAQHFGYGIANLGGAKAFSSFIYQAGGRLVDNEDEPTKFMMHEPEAVRGVQFMADLAAVHGISPTPREQRDLGAVNDLYMSGKIAMRYGESTHAGEYKAIEDFEWGMAEPARGANQATWVGGACYTANATTSHPEEAVNYVFFATGPEGAAIMARNLVGVPAVKAIAETAAFLDNEPNLQTALDTFSYGVQPPMIPTFPEWNRLILNALDPVWLGEQTAEEALTAIAPEAQALIDEGREMYERINE